MREVVGKVFLFSFPVAFGIGLWLLWNLLIFKDPLFFALGPFSARAQQAAIAKDGGLITKNNLPVSLIAYSYAVTDNIGPFALVISGLGLAYYVISRKQRGILTQILIIIFLSAPVLFNVFALFLGFSIINVPQLGWNPSGEPSAIWFNVRYGILALPLVAVGVGLFSGLRKYLAALITVEIIVLQLLIMYPNNVITITDGTIGTSAYRNNDLSDALRGLVKPQDTILLSLSFFNPVAFRSNIELKQVIHEGVSKQWNYAVVYPERYAKWVIMASGDIGEPVYESLIKNQRGRFLEYYELAYTGKHGNIYSLKSKLGISIKH
jgi:NADH:ubiquinone oxidoreductase subunit 5 (subunit L)/multisubunit Na+/H+ antiporter MnhA subunit